MNLFELLFVIAGLSISLMAATLATQRWNVGWGILAFVLSGAGWVLLLPLGNVALRLLNRIVPLRPVCRTGRCVSDDYEYLGLHDDVPLFRCQCGREYIKQGSLFLERDATGELHPYMRRAWGLFWRPQRD